MNDKNMWNKQTKKPFCGLLLISVTDNKIRKQIHHLKKKEKKRNDQSVVTFWAIGNKHTQQNEWNVKCLYIYTIKKNIQKCPLCPWTYYGLCVTSPVTNRITMHSNTRHYFVSKNRIQYLQYLKMIPLVKTDMQTIPWTQPLKNVCCQTSATIAHKWLCLLF